VYEKFFRYELFRFLSVYLVGDKIKGGLYAIAGGVAEATMRIIAYNPTLSSVPRTNETVKNLNSIVENDFSNIRSTMEKNENRRWYAIQTYSGYEDAVARYLSQRVESLAMTDKIFNVVVPKEVKIGIKSGKRHKVEEKIYPGYVLVEMVLDNDSWYVVRNTPRVTGFVGQNAATPTPLSEAEVQELLGRIGEKEPVYQLDLVIDETVRIIDGPFKDNEGKVAEIDEEKGKIKVLVPVFGRDTLVELDSLQVQKI